MSYISVPPGVIVLSAGFIDAWQNRVLDPAADMSLCAGQPTLTLRSDGTVHRIWMDGELVTVGEARAIQRPRSPAGRRRLKEAARSRP